MLASDNKENVYEIANSIVKCSPLMFHVSNKVSRKGTSKMAFKVSSRVPSKVASKVSSKVPSKTRRANRFNSEISNALKQHFPFQTV